MKIDKHKFFMKFFSFEIFMALISSYDLCERILEALFF